MTLVDLLEGNLDGRLVGRSYLFYSFLFSAIKADILKHGGSARPAATDKPRSLFFSVRAEVIGADGHKWSDKASLSYSMKGKTTCVSCFRQVYSRPLFLFRSDFSSIFHYVFANVYSSHFYLIF